MIAETGKSGRSGTRRKGRGAPRLDARTLRSTCDVALDEEWAILGDREERAV